MKELTFKGKVSNLLYDLQDVKADERYEVVLKFYKSLPDDTPTKQSTDEAQESKRPSDLLLFHDVENGGYTISLEETPYLIVEVDKIEDVPKELATSFEVMLQYLIESKRYKIIDVPPKAGIEKGGDNE